uniref:Peptidase M16 C-terminal domain-containing protein n=1 Tax=Skeletonema marinoi TaxID=267567 RepID=A0A7S2PN78_9STRA|mmetsp:Transcript_25997/g.44168  ORF Transcript_25997/g.44168 Transcript_25997/m.44168 type:complete len:437 (+) Transcript_25997:24-1334(+)
MTMLLVRPVVRTSARRMSTVAASTVSSDVQSYISEAPAATVSTLGNGVTVASLYNADGSGSGYTTVRLSGVGSRFDSVGGEAAILASSMGGVVGREHISLSSISSLSADAATSNLDALKGNLSCKLAGLSYESQMMDHLHSTAYQNGPTGNSLGNALEGSAESVASVSADDVASLLGGVNGTNVVVVGTGNGSHEKLVAEAEKAYGSLSGASGSKAVGSVADKSAFIGSDVRIRYDSHNTATIALGFEGASWTDPKAMPLALMSTLLGSFSKSDGLGKNVAAAMCQEVADHELASSISVFNLSYSDTGLFGMVATAPDNKLDDLLWYVMPNFVRLAHGVSDEEFTRAKVTLKTQILASFDGDVAAGEQMAQQIGTVGRVVSLTEMMAKVDALTMDDVKAAAGDVINDQDHALAAIGGIHELPDYNWIRRHSYMLRY